MTSANGWVDATEWLAAANVAASSPRQRVPDHAEPFEISWGEGLIALVAAVVTILVLGRSRRG